MSNGFLSLPTSFNKVWLRRLSTNSFFMVKGRSSCITSVFPLFSISSRLSRSKCLTGEGSLGVPMVATAFTQSILRSAINMAVLPGSGLRAGKGFHHFFKEFHCVYTILHIARKIRCREYCPRSPQSSKIKAKHAKSCLSKASVDVVQGIQVFIAGKAMTNSAKLCDFPRPASPGNPQVAHFCCCWILFCSLSTWSQLSFFRVILPLKQEVVQGQVSRSGERECNKGEEIKEP